ncbi:hypothetical protein [Streptomyces antibioticus]|uniref:hypothetical protein n=1 Tax=Streptomyces antibioticus TaxID=1890 RepID=UPI0033C9955F
MGRPLDQDRARSGTAAGVPGLLAETFAAPQALIAAGLGTVTVVLSFLWKKVPGPVRKVPAALVAVGIGIGIGIGGSPRPHGGVVLPGNHPDAGGLRAAVRRGVRAGLRARLRYAQDYGPVCGSGQGQSYGEGEGAPGPSHDYLHRSFSGAAPPPVTHRASPGHGPSMAPPPGTSSVRQRTTPAPTVAGPFTHPRE